MDSNPFNNHEDMTMHEAAGISMQDEDMLEGTLVLVNELLESVTTGMQQDILETAITVLREAIREADGDSETKAKAEVALIKALITRFACHGWVEDLDEATRLLKGNEAIKSAFILELQMMGHEGEHYPEIVTFSLNLLHEYRQSIDKSNLDTAITVANEALASHHGVINHRAQLSLRAGNALVLRYLSCGDEKDFSLARALFHDAKEACGTGDPMLFIALVDLRHVGFVNFLESGMLQGMSGLQEMAQYGQAAQAEDQKGQEAYILGSELMQGDKLAIDEAILQFRRSLSLRPPQHPRRHDTLAHCALALGNRFGCTGQIKDLEESISLHKEALSLRPHGHPDRAVSLNNLANALSTRFDNKGNFLDLDECIALHREALDLRPHGHPHRAGSLNNLANALSTRFDNKGDFRDLDECIALHREALDLRPHGHPDRASSLNNLAGALSTRFDNKGDFRDLDECIALHREALSLFSRGNPHRAGSLNNLAVALSTRFRNKGDFRDLDECIALHREVLDLHPHGHPDRASSLNNLANALFARFGKTHDFPDLEECIRHRREHLEISFLSPEDQQSDNCALGNHTEGLKAIVSLVQSLRENYKHLGDNDTLQEIFALLETGVRCHGASPLVRLDHARLWASICREFHRPRTALDAYRHGISSLPVLASLDLTLEQRQNVLVYAKDLSKDAVQCAIEQNELDTALVFLSTARSVFWSQALQFRGSLDRLNAVHPDLASELRTVTRQLQFATEQQPQTRTIPSGSTQPLRPYLLSQQREEIIAKIRDMEGFHDFLLPPSPDILKTAASKGTIVFLNASNFGCHALILKEDGTLHRLALFADIVLLTCLVAAIRQLARGREIGLQVRREMRDYLVGRDLRLKAFFKREDPHLTVDDDFKVVLRVLWDRVGQPVVQALRLEKTNTPRRIWWCPTGPFTFLPIHAAGNYTPSPLESECLSDYIVSSYCSTPQDLITPQPVPNPDFKMLVVIEPDRPEPGVSSLPSTRQELEKIKLHIPENDRLITRAGPKSSSGKSILDDINTASIVHFGCHGMQDPSNPLDSYLLLSDRRLTMSSLIRDCQTSTAALAYLSACETAMGDDQRPDESLTLAATMQFAGFRSVVATMWSIHDHDAPIVADAFYRHLFRHGTAAPPDVTDAAYGLHLAVKELREQGTSFHRWVPFVHHGV